MTQTNYYKRMIRPVLSVGGVSVIPGVLKSSQRDFTIAVVVKCYVSVRRSRFPVHLSALVGTSLRAAFHASHG